MIGLSRLKRAIADVPTGGMQTGTSKVQLKLCDAQRIEVEYGALIAERDAALAQNADFEQRINQFIKSISQLSNHVVDLQNTRDDLERQNDELMAQVEALRVAALNAIHRMSGGEAKADLRDAYDATPSRCLRDVQAEAGRAGFVAGLEYPDKVHFEGATRNPVFAADQYADRIRRGEA